MNPQKPFKPLRLFQELKNLTRCALRYFCRQGGLRRNLNLGTALYPTSKRTMSKNIIRKGCRRTAFLIAHQKFRISDWVRGLANVRRDRTWDLIHVLFMIFWMCKFSLTWSFARAYEMPFEENVLSNRKGRSNKLNNHTRQLRNII
jgi:hypothetical protein